MIEESLVLYIKTVTDNVFPLLLPGTTPPLPAVVYTPASARITRGIGGVAHGEFARIQLDVYAAGYLQAKQLARLLRAIDGFAGDWHGIEVGIIQVEFGVESFDEGLYRVRFDLLINY